MSKHKSQQKEESDTTNYQLYSDLEILDFTEKKISTLLITTKTPQRKEQLEHLLKDYKACLVKIAWKRGEPIFIKNS